MSPLTANNQILSTIKSFMWHNVVPTADAWIFWGGEKTLYIITT
jgi:hypothetical protein